MKYEPYECEPLRQQTYWVLEFLLTGLLFLMLWGAAHAERVEWWARFSPLEKHLLEGLGFLAFGSAFLVCRVRLMGTLLPTGILDLKLLLFDLALVVGGAVCLVEAVSTR